MKFTFIDLFSGVGAFNMALTSLGGTCLFSSEIDRNCSNVYKENFHLDSLKDIRSVVKGDLPEGFDVLCAGFPCQPFSKAGKQEGFEDPSEGTLFFQIERILKIHRAKFILLENVRNLVSMDNGYTWKIICNKLTQLGYRLNSKPLILSPHQFGVPQLRERVYIVGKYDPDNIDKPLNIVFNNLKSKEENNAYLILDKKLKSDLSERTIHVLKVWEDFQKHIDKTKLGFPIWGDYFKNPPTSDMPDWKKEFVIKNNLLYKRNRDFIDYWLRKNSYFVDFTASERKFEWEAGNKISSVFDGLIQFRPSGIRVKKPDVFPTLVAIVQRPIIGKFKRYISVKEGQKLQSFNKKFSFGNESEQVAFKQLGNSANVKVIKEVAKKLFVY